ncbi:zinc finger protein PLAG1 [Halyomorpha halys]|uniref:zinc finger protein PLAG1 n=1 Tax=Halyomorpha halys TaxID=286706 RepID=UPI0006D4F94A|nr:zinc finger protein PLAG1-like [Halyomorpha halys]
MDPGSSKDPCCPYCEQGHVGPCSFGTPQKQHAEFSAETIAPPETPKKQKNFLCEDCGKAFKTRRKLTQHKSIHSGEKRYTCEHCTKGFSSKFKLVRHMVVHSKVRDWECEACGTGFRRKDHLEAHLRQHCGERTVFPCQLCSKTYTCKGSLRKHLALHSAQSGDLKCQLCQHVAPDQEAIIQHVRGHTGSRLSKSAADKKYRCSDCDRSFFTRKDAERHSVVHNRSRDFLCQFCPRTYGRSDHLSRHIEKSHGSHESEAGPSSSLELSTVDQLDKRPASTNVLPGFTQAFRDV